MLPCCHAEGQRYGSPFPAGGGTCNSPQRHLPRPASCDSDMLTTYAHDMLSQVKRRGRSWRCCSEIVVIAPSFRLGPTATRTTAAAPLAAHEPETIVDCTAAHGPVRSPGDLVHCIQRGWVPHGCPKRAVGTGTVEARERASKRPRQQRPPSSSRSSLRLRIFSSIWRNGGAYRTISHRKQVQLHACTGIKTQTFAS